MFAWQATVQDEFGNTVTLPVVTVYEEDGTTLADIFDESGLPLDNPLTGSLDGFVQFWAYAGQYKIVGANGGDVTQVWSVAIDAPALRAEAWAESPTSPDPLDPTSKSSKTWAAVAAQAALALAIDSNVTYYVSPTGSDANDGFSPSSPFLTLQAAANAARWLRLNGYTITISIAAGTYSAGVVIGGGIVGASNVSNLSFVGDVVAPGSVIVNVAGGNCFHATNDARYHVDGVTLITTGSGNCLNAVNGGMITHGNVVFDSCAGFHKQAIQGGQVHSTGGYSITGGAVAHLHATTGGLILVNGGTVGITGTPSFSQYFVGVSGAFVQAQAGVVWSGAITGKAFAVHNGGAIRTFDQGLPGTVAGDAYGGGTMDDIHTLEVFRNASSPMLVVNNANSSGGEVARFRGQRLTPANNDAFWNHFQARDDAGQDVNVGRITWTLVNVANGSETGHLTFGAIHNGAMVNALRVTGTSVQSILPLKLPVYTVEGAPSAGAAGQGAQVYISNESGGGVVAFSDGTVWRRVTDRAVIS